MQSFCQNKAGEGIDNLSDMRYNLFVKDSFYE